MPCQNSIESTPATLKISEKAKKYHFLPRKSMLVLVNSCTASPLNAQRLATLVAGENAIEDDARDKYRREQVGQQTKAQRDGESANWAGSEEEQNNRRDDGGHMCIDDRDPGMSKALFHRRWRRLTVTQLFADAL